MKVILENELEKYAWVIMMAAHYKWEKNHGASLNDQMDWYFKDIYKEETVEAIKAEVERRLRNDFGEEFFVGEDEYVNTGLVNNDVDNVSPEERELLEKELREEYVDIQKDIEENREPMFEEVGDELNNSYYIFFNAPEKLTVIFKDEVIQSSE